MKRILLIAVNAKYIHSNLAVYSLKAYASAKGCPAELAEFTINQGRDEILKGIYRRAPQVVCFSCYIWNISYVRELIGDLAKVLPDVEIWVGGPEVSFDAEQFLTENPAVRGVMRGEGEETFACLADKDFDESCLSGIKGITYRGCCGRIRTNPGREILDLSEVAFPYGDLSDFEHRIIYYESSRGCPFSCSYCLSSVDKKLRFRSLDLVREELQFFLDHRVPQVKFVDRTFNCRESHALAVWEYLDRHDNGVTNFHFEIAADQITERELELFRGMRPGLIQLEIGVQSTNPDTIRAIHRQMDFQKAADVVMRVQEGRNIHQHLDLIAGLPHEDYERFSVSFQEVYRLHPQQLQLGFLKVLKGSFMHEHIGEYQGRYQGKEPYEILSTGWLPYGDVLRLKQVEEMVEVYYNSGQFQHTLRALETRYENMFRFYEALGAYYEERGYEGISHSRMQRYVILLEFLELQFPGETEELRQCCVLDVYSRENAKSRPPFARDLGVYKEIFRKFYQREEQQREILSSYEGYDWKQMMKMTHLEVISGQEERFFLFDYREQDVLTGSARCVDVTGEMREIQREEQNHGDKAYQRDFGTAG